MDENNNKKLIKSLLAALLLLAVLGALVVSVLLYFDSRNKLDSTTVESPVSRSDQNLTDGKSSDEDIINRVKKHILLPNEDPQVVTLDNVADLKKDQQFFAGAENGDVILVFSQKVILYSPQKDIIVEVAYIKPDQQLPQEVSGISSPSAETE